MIAVAWMVITPDGFRAVFLERVRADHYATCCHGIVRPLVFGDEAPA